MVTYIIGDPTGMLQELAGIGSGKAAEGGSITPSIMNESFAATPVYLGTIDYSPSDLAQFDEKLELITGDVDGNICITSLNARVAVAEPETNISMRKIDFSDAPLELSQYSCLRMDVKATTIVNLNLMPVAAKGRNGSCGC